MRVSALHTRLPSAGLAAAGSPRQQGACARSTPSPRQNASPLAARRPSLRARHLVPNAGLGSDEPDDSFVSKLEEEVGRARAASCGRNNLRSSHHIISQSPLPIAITPAQISTEEDFAAHVASADVVVADFMARWCRKCIYIKVCEGMERERKWR